MAPQSCLTATPCFTLPIFIRQRIPTCTRRNLSFWHPVCSLESDYLNSAHQLHWIADSCHEPVMLKSHIPYLDKTCLNLVQNWKTDCPLKQGVSRIGLAKFGVITGGYWRVTLSEILCPVDLTLNMTANAIYQNIDNYQSTRDIFQNTWECVGLYLKNVVEGHSLRRGTSPDAI